MSLLANCSMLSLSCNFITCTIGDPLELDTNVIITMTILDRNNKFWNFMNDHLICSYKQLKVLRL